MPEKGNCRVIIKWKISKLNFIKRWYCFKSKSDTIFEPIKMADIDNFQTSMAGFSISDGGTANINFGVSDGALAIRGIND